METPSWGPLAYLLLVWGVITSNESVTYLSMMPLAVALLTSKFMQRNGL